MLLDLFLLCVLCTVPSAKYPALSEETVESSETSPDLSPLHALLPCGTMALHEDLSKQPVEPGRPTRISVCRGKCGLGVKVIGGSDTSLVSTNTCTHHFNGHFGAETVLSPVTAC